MSHLDHSNGLLTDGPAFTLAPPQSSPHMSTRVIFAKHKSDQITFPLKPMDGSSSQWLALSLPVPHSNLLLSPTAGPPSPPSSLTEPLIVQRTSPTCQAHQWDVSCTLHMAESPVFLTTA